MNKRKHSRECITNFFINKHNLLKNNYINFFLFISVFLLSACSSINNINQVRPSLLSCNELTKLNQAIRENDKEWQKKWYNTFREISNNTYKNCCNNSTYFSYIWPALPSALKQCLINILWTSINPYIPIRYEDAEMAGNLLVSMVGTCTGTVFDSLLNQLYTDLGNRSNNILSSSNATNAPLYSVVNIGSTMLGRLMLYPFLDVFSEPCACLLGSSISKSCRYLFSKPTQSNQKLPSSDYKQE